MFDKVLIANRGEIAGRIIRTLREMGIARRGLLRGRPARSTCAWPTRRCRSGPPAAARATSDRQASSTLARRSGADAIHPGYGFLSENADFARGACRPRASPSSARPPSASRRWATRSKRGRAIAAGVPIVPGARRHRRRPDAAATVAARRSAIPVMLKASAGGGGKGMRLVDEPRRARERAASARGREAQERLRRRHRLPREGIVKPRHVEIQVLGDRTATSSTSSSATARSSAATRRSSRRRRRPACRRRDASRDGRGGGRGRARPSATSAPAPSSSSLGAGRQLLLPRDEHAPPGRAPGHRAGHRHRSRRADGPRRRRRAARDPAGATSSRTARRSSAASTPRIRTATSCRRSDASMLTVRRPRVRRAGDVRDDGGVVEGARSRSTTIR